jgi:hypothetical protein
MVQLQGDSNMFIAPMMDDFASHYGFESTQAEEELHSLLTRLFERKGGQADVSIEGGALEVTVFREVVEDNRTLALGQIHRHAAQQIHPDFEVGDEIGVPVAGDDWLDVLKSVSDRPLLDSHPQRWLIQELTWWKVQLPAYKRSPHKPSEIMAWLGLSGASVDSTAIAASAATSRRASGSEDDAGWCWGTGYLWLMNEQWIAKAQAKGRAWKSGAPKVSVHTVNAGDLSTINEGNELLPGRSSGPFSS